MTDSWFLSKNGKQFGPFDYNQILTMIETRQISPKDLLYKQGTDGWQLAENISEPAIFNQTRRPESPDSSLQEWYVAKGSVQSGPFSLTQLHSMIHKGQVHRNDLASKPGMTGWVPISRLFQNHDSPRPDIGQPAVDMKAFQSIPSSPKNQLFGVVRKSFLVQIKELTQTALVASALKWTHFVLACMGVLVTFLPWYSATSSASAGGAHIGGGIASTIGLIVFPFGSLSFASNIATICLIFLYPHRIALTALAASNFICVLASAAILSSAPSFSFTSGVSIEGYSSTGSFSAGISSGFFIAFLNALFLLLNIGIKEFLPDLVDRILESAPSRGNIK